VGDSINDEIVFGRRIVTYPAELDELSHGFAATTLVNAVD
jgi:hypothetical protein